ncbi:MAG: rod-binding protein [Pseudomonadota bacterium]
MTDAAAISPASLSPPMAGSLSPQQLERTKAAAEDFEAVFLSEMMSHMFEGVGTDPVFGGGAGEDIFRGMLVQEYGRQMTKGHGVGISDQLQKVMIQMQQQR